RSAIAASTHLVLFIAVYQPIESMQRRNGAQRLLTAALIFIASLATATHIAIVPFVIVFAFFFFRQLIHISHLDSLEAARATARHHLRARLTERVPSAPPRVQAFGNPRRNDTHRPAGGIHPPGNDPAAFHHRQPALPAGRLVRGDRPADLRGSHPRFVLGLEP